MAVTGKSSAGFWQRVIRNQANESSGLKHSSWPPTGGRSSAKNRTKRSQDFPNAFLVTALHLSDVCSIRPFWANSPKNKGKMLVLKTQNVEVVRSRRKRHFRGSKGGAGRPKNSRRMISRDDFRHQRPQQKKITRTSGGAMKGETLAKCLLYILVITLGHVGAGGPANVDKNIFFEDFACCSVFAMTENRGKKQGFSTRSDAKKNATPKKTIQEDQIF
jgi:hypothetical protein